MITLNLIERASSDIPYTAMVFPDGQPHIKLDTLYLKTAERSAPVRILSRIASSNDLLQIVFAKNVLDHLEFQSISLDISYLMAARMDRVMLEGEPFSLKVVAGILNAAKFRKVRVFDPHSEVTAAVIDHAYEVPNHHFVKDVLAQHFGGHTAGDFSLVSPDAGALKKIHKLAKFLDVSSVVECFKERDLKTGMLSKFKTATEDLVGKACFIVDDICDGGGTFAGTAGMLKEKGAGEIALVVSHGIFSKGTRIENVDHIYTTDSYRFVEGVHCFPVQKYLE